MSLFEGKTPSERNKLIAAMGLGALAILSLAYMLFGSSTGGRPTLQPVKKGAANSSTRTDVIRPPVTAELLPEETLQPIPVAFRAPEVPEAERNIFVFYTPPPRPSPTPVIVVVPSPSPSPPPPLLLAGVTPSNVYARTGDFPLEVSGDKFTPSSKIVINGRELPTRYISAQQLSAIVPATWISSEGGRQVGVRTPDGKLFSNTATLNVMSPPAPNYAYIGALIGKRSNDVALLQDKGTKEVFNAQRGDILGGRFRLTSISDREVWFVDTTLHVKHTLPFSGGNPAEAGTRMQPQGQPTRPVMSDDDEP